MNYSQSQTSEPIIVPTARWVVLVMLLIAVLASAAFLLSWRDFKYADSTRKALIWNIQTIRDSYDPVLASVQRQLREAQAKDRDLQGELSILTDRLQLAQDEVELARRQARQWTRRSNSISSQGR
jgi:hypothetical protein